MPSGMPQVRLCSLARSSMPRRTPANVPSLNCAASLGTLPTANTPWPPHAGLNSPCSIFDSETREGTSLASGTWASLVEHSGGRAPGHTIWFDTTPMAVRRGPTQEGDWHER